MVRRALVAILALTFPAMGQSARDFRRTFDLHPEGLGDARLEVAPTHPTAAATHQRDLLTLRLTLDGVTWTGGGLAKDADVFAYLIREGATEPAQGPGAVGALQGEQGGARPAALPERFRLELLDESRGRLQGLGLPKQGLPLTASRAVLPIDGEAWLKLPAAAKQAALWTVAGTHPYPADGLPVLGSMEALNGHVLRTMRRLVTETPHLVASFEKLDDVRPPHWKLRHPFGAIACATFEPEPGHPYRGMLDRTSPAIVRLSINVDSPTDFIASIGLKLLVSGGHSVNVLASGFYDPTRAADAGLFAHELDNRNKRGRLQLDHVVSGASPVPHLLRFLPAPGLPREGSGDFRHMLAGVPAGTLLYRVVDQDGVPVGRVTTTSGFVASDSGDRLFLFAHHAKPIPGQGIGKGDEEEGGWGD